MDKRVDPGQVTGLCDSPPGAAEAVRDRGVLPRVDSGMRPDVHWLDRADDAVAE